VTEGSDLVTISALSPNHVGAYLRTRGWRDAGPFGANGRLYSKVIADEVQELVLPTRTSLTDFTKRMSELAEDLARAEDRPTSAVIFDLTLTAFDVIRVRSRDADEYGSVRFSDDVQLFEEAQNLLVASARAASSDVPRRVWKGRRPESIIEYLQRVRLGQTEKSSFSLTVLSPYAFEPSTEARQQRTLFSKDAFGRRITLKFADALNAIEVALADAVTDPIPAFDRTIEAGVSADLCEALGNLADNEGGVELSVSWSPAKPVSDAVVRLSLTPREGAILKEVARVFASAEPTNTRIEGIITQISEDPRTFDGSTTIEAAVEGRLRRVQVKFNPDDRNALIEAFRGRMPIAVEGELTSEGNRLKLNNPHRLNVLDED